MSAFALLVIVMTFPLILKSQMVCIQNTDSLETASPCTYQAQSGKRGEKGQKGEAGKLNTDLVALLESKFLF